MNLTLKKPTYKDFQLQNNWFCYEKLFEQWPKNGYFNEKKMPQHNTDSHINTVNIKNIRRTTIETHQPNRPIWYRDTKTLFKQSISIEVKETSSGRDHLTYRRLERSRKTGRVEKSNLNDLPFPVCANLSQWHRRIFTTNYSCQDCLGLYERTSYLSLKQIQSSTGLKFKCAR